MITFYILGDKNGYRPFPPQIEKEEFEAILQNLKSSEKSTGVLTYHFKLDENAVPPSYILLPITSVYPLYRSNIAAERKSASDAVIFFLKLLYFNYFLTLYYSVVGSV